MKTKFSVLSILSTIVLFGCTMVVTDKKPIRDKEEVPELPESISISEEMDAILVIYKSNPSGIPENDESIEWSIHLSS